MYATSADWKVNDGTWSTEQEKKMTAKMKSLGAPELFSIMYNVPQFASRN